MLYLFVSGFLACTILSVLGISVVQDIMALNNLGRLLEITGPKDMAEAETMYRRVLTIEHR